MHKALTLLVTGTMVAALFALSAVPAAAQETVLSLEKVGEIAVNATDMEFAPPHLYLLTETGIEVYDLSDPDSPQKVGAYETDAELVDMAKEGDRLYAIDAHNAYVIDVSQPISPTLLAQVDVGPTRDGLGGAPAVTVENGILYVLAGTFDEQAGKSICEVRLFDLSDPQQAQSLSAYSIVSASCGGYLFVEGKTVVFTYVGLPTHGGCCESLSVYDVGEDWELTGRTGFAIRYLSAQAIGSPLGGPDSIAYIGTAVEAPPNAPCSDMYVIRSFRAEAGATLSAPRHPLPLCTGRNYERLAAWGSRLYAIVDVGASDDARFFTLVAYERTGPEGESSLTSYRFASVRGLTPQVAAENERVIVFHKNDVLALRWVEAPVVERGFLPIVH